MSLFVALHEPTSASIHVFAHGGRDVANVRLTDRHGDGLDIYTTPEQARAIAEIINAPQEAAE